MAVSPEVFRSELLQLGFDPVAVNDLRRTAMLESARLHCPQGSVWKSAVYGESVVITVLGGHACVVRENEHGKDEAHVTVSCLITGRRAVCTVRMSDPVLMCAERIA